MKKVKFRFNRSEMQALRLSVEISVLNGGSSGLTHKAAQHILGKLWLRMVGRCLTLKEEGNSMTFTVPELWALKVQTETTRHLVGTYENVLLDRICNEAHRLTA